MLHAPARFACTVAAVSLLGAPAWAQAPDRHQLERIEQTLRREGQEIVALADAASGGGEVAADFGLAWHNDFLKAQTGTFIPFIVTIDARSTKAETALVYVRAVRRRAAGEGPRRGRRAAVPAAPSYPFEEIYPVALGAAGQPIRIERGCSLPAGQYDVTVVVRERAREETRRQRPAAAVLRQTLDVPDFTTAQLTTSSVMLADAVTVLTEPLSTRELIERPYVIGNREIEPAADAEFRRSEELIVVLLVYNPTVTTTKHFDLEVEYHFFRKSRAGPEEPAKSAPAGVAPLPGEQYFNRTEPQRFNPVILGPQFDPSAGQPVLAGQGVPLAGFPEGDYRLAVKVTDVVGRQALERHIGFTVRP